MLNTFSYTYGDSTWKDLLTYHNGNYISYDTIGNPVMIDNAELTWQGRTLTEYYNGDYEYLNFGYNADGIRTSKEYSCPETGAYGKHTYVLNGSQIISETYTYEDYDGNVENWTIVYIYDETGSPIGMKYREPYYAAGVYDCFFFEKNLQGDIIAVYNSNGTKLITYDYDAWGNCTESYASQFSARGANYNPFRYRGYYYDVETGWYYLQSRYYNPEWGRFINPDDHSILLETPDQLTDKNLFAYCDNNPIMRIDGDGEFWNFIIGGVVGAIAGGVVAALNGEDATGIFIGALAGAASGVVAASGLGLVAQAGISAGISALSDVANQTLDIAQNGGTISDYNIEQTVTEAALGFFTSVAGSTLGNIVDSKLTKNLLKSNKIFNQYLNKTFSAGLRKEVGRSTSSLLRQANNFLKQSNCYLNTYRGISSCVGSVVSLWNIAR